MAGEGGAGERVQVIQSSNTIYNIYNTTRHSSSLTKSSLFILPGDLVPVPGQARYWTGTCKWCDRPFCLWMAFLAFCFVNPLVLVLVV